MIYLILLFAAIASGQTSTAITPSQVRPPQQSAVIACASVSGTIRCDFATLDPSLSISVDSQGKLTIRATGASSTEKTVLFNIASSTQLVFTIPDAGFVPSSVIVTRNGLMQAPGDDYSVNGQTVTLALPSQAVLGDKVLIRYRF